ncbi:lipocalin family protein [Aureisphaera galaxeae]|uniref:lipocalin family protein n=1 Tax=Aureisphaera galaxeae TaxID=1538023 RepID=UPI00234FC55F|nr:lipocalin family protein [Aureisphaera galaxeae]MDC8003559.1 lipocalin family protein [Aureisphaera galaxeae]
MKKACLLVLAMAFFVACKTSQNDNALIGKWKLTEVLVDIGDGSGTYYKAEEEKYITFYEDGSVTTTGSFCAMGTGDPKATKGTYSVKDGIIESDRCINQVMKTRYSLTDGVLEVLYPCIEACSEKYIKAN